MTELIGRIKQNIFLLSAVSAGFLGVALAYLGSVLLSYFLFTKLGLITPSDQANQSAQASRITGPPARPLDEFVNMIAGNFFQGTISGDAENPAPVVQLKPFTLIGVLAGHASFARAAIQIEGENEVKEYRIGQEVAGSKLVWIGTNYITVDQNGSRVKIKVGEKSVAAAERQAEKPKEAASDPNAKKVTIQRSRVIELSKDPSKLNQNAMAPITRDKKIVGLKMTFIPPNSLLYEMGARSGDIIRRVDGQKLENHQKLYQLWQSMQTASKVSVEIERAGKIVPYEIIIQN